MTRGDVSGEIRELKRGHLYSIRVRLPPDSRHKSWHWSKSRKIAGNKNRAIAALSEYADELALDSGRIPEDITVAKYARFFQENRPASLSPGTVKRDEIETRRIEEHFSDIKLRDLTAADLNRVYSRLRKEGLSPNSLFALNRKMKQILKQAVRLGAIVRNPCDQIDDVKKPKPKERRSLTLEQAIRLASDLKAEKRNGCVVAVWIALATGARRGEILALTWNDIDFAKKRVYINKQLDDNKSIRKPKSEKSIRNLAIDEGTIIFLKEWEDMVSKEFYGGGDIPPESPICTNELGEHLNPSFFNRWRREYFASHGLGHFQRVEKRQSRNGEVYTRGVGYEGFNLHELRHTQATLLIGRGADIKTVQNRLGHSSASLTMNIYAHAIEQNDREAANAIGNVLGL